MAENIIDKLNIDIKLSDDAARKGIEKLITLSKELKEVTGKLGKDQGLQKTINGITEVTAHAPEMNKAIDDTGEVSLKSGRSVEKLGTFFSGMRMAAEKTLTPLANFFNSIKRIAMYRMIRTALKLMTQGFTEGIRNVYQYSKIVNTSFAPAMDRISTSFLHLKNSIGAMVSPLLGLFIPILDKVIDKVISFTNMLNQAFASIAGKETWTKAIRYATEFGDGLSGANKIAKDLKRTIFGFDELNVLQKNTPSDSGKDYSLMFEEMKLTEQSHKIASNLKDILWYVGAIALGIQGWKIAKLLSDIGLAQTGIKGLAGTTFTVIGTIVFIKGIKSALADELDPKNFTEIVTGSGIAIGGLFMVKAAAGFIGMIPVGIGMMFTALWDAIKNRLNLLNASLLDLGATLIGAGVGFLVGGPVGAAIGALIGFLVGEVAKAGVWISENWEKVTETFKLNWQIAGTFFSTLWKGLKYDFSQIGEFFKKSWSAWVDTANNIAIKLKNIWKSYSDFMQNLSDKILGFFKNIGIKVADFTTDVFKKSLNGLFSGVESTINFFLKGINGAIGIINKLPGVKISTVQPLQIPRLAEGGLPPVGQMFVARESGPELVGTIGNKSAVVNNDQIVQSVSKGVAEGVSRAMEPMLKSSDVINIYLDGVLERTIKGMDRRNTRAGRTIVPVEV